MESYRFSAPDIKELLNREWLATNGIGGFAASTLAGLNTRKYHGLLVAAMAPPVRRMVLLSRVEETLQIAGRPFTLAANEYPDVIHPQGHQFLRSFAPTPCPTWIYQSDAWRLRKMLTLVPRENTVCLSYSLLEADAPAQLELRPLMAMRGIHELMYQSNGTPEAQEHRGHWRIAPTSRTPEVFFAADGEFCPGGCWYFNTIYRREVERGYAGLEDLWMPGSVTWPLSPGQTVHFVCSAEPIDLSRVAHEAQHRMSFADAREAPDAIVGRKPAYELLARAADQFILTTRNRATMIVGGYPWSVPSTRTALMALTGLLLIPGRLDEARSLLQLVGSTSRRGVIASFLAEDGSGWKYTAADPSLWFVHAVDQYLRYGGDASAARQHLLPVVDQIIASYQAGTDPGIGVDAEGLLRCGVKGVATTWMDAHAGDWVVTPRIGRPVEINALWYNALCAAAAIHQRFGNGTRVQQLLVQAQTVHVAFNKRFWNAAEGCCFDVLGDEGPDASIRPNQILAISLPFPVLQIDRHRAVLQKMSDHLLTPVGLRTLSPKDPAYHGRYAGSVQGRDAAFHQGSVFPWLLGPFITAYLRVNGLSTKARDEARAMLAGVLDHMAGDGVGQLCQLFDGDAPHRPGGATASARAVGEILRCYVEDILGRGPGEPAPLHRIEIATIHLPARKPVPES